MFSLSASKKLEPRSMNNISATGKIMGAIQVEMN